MNIRVFTLLLSALCLSGCASVQDIQDYTGTIAPGDGVLVIVINSDISFQDLRLTRPHDAFSAIAARSVPSGRTVRFVEMPAGEYQWVRVDVSDNGYMRYWIPLDKDKEQRYYFTIKPGVINYPGDFEVGTDSRSFDDSYFIQLIDRSAMLLEELHPEQRRMLDTTGWIYTGPGSDEFPGYFQSLVIAQKGKLP